ncbi:MAG: response regulator [Candidatus Thiodiazotropha sp. 6PLUC9]
MSKQAFLVDDSKSARIVLSRMLKKSGFDEVEMAESGEEALERLKSLTPDAIFVDFLMDGIDGLETITEIKKDLRFDTTPIVMCTANEGDEYVRAAVDHGALGILAKPPTEASLGEIIDLIDAHQQEVAATKAAESELENEQSEVSPEIAASTEGVAGLSEADVRRIAEEVAAQSGEQAARQTAEQITRDLAEKVIAESLDQRLSSMIHDYLEQKLEPMVSELVSRTANVDKPVEIDSDALKKGIVEEVNHDLEDFVRQLNQRNVEELIQSTIFSQVGELRDDFNSRLKDQEERILSQVPEKNDMIEHIRVITEGSLEAHIHETATQVSQEISNSVATETVEQMLEQHFAQQSVEQQPESGGKMIWILLGALVAASAGAAYFLL